MNTFNLLRRRGRGRDRPGDAAPDGLIQVVIPETERLTGEARQVFHAAVLRFGEDLIIEAGLLEFGGRGEGLTEVVYTPTMIVQAHDEVRPSRAARQPVEYWRDVLKVIAGGLILFAGAGFGFAASASTTKEQLAGGIPFTTWVAVGLALSTVALLFTATAVFVPRRSK